MSWIDTCETGEEALRRAEATKARRKASWAKPKPPPTSEHQSAFEEEKLTVGGKPVKSNLVMVYEFAEQIKIMQEAGWIREPPKIKSIIDVTAYHFEVTANDILGQCRTAIVVLPRQMAMYLAKKLTPKSLTEIGRRFGDRDHTTVLHALRKIERLIKTDEQLAAAVVHLTAVLERNP